MMTTLVVHLLFRVLFATTILAFLQYLSAQMEDGCWVGWSTCASLTKLQPLTWISVNHSATQIHWHQKKRLVGHWSCVFIFFYTVCPSQNFCTKKLFRTHVCTLVCNVYLCMCADVFAHLFVGRTSAGINKEWLGKRHLCFWHSCRVSSNILG